MRDRFGDQMPQPRAVWQAGQRVVISELRDLGARFLTLDRKRAEVNAGLDDPFMPARGCAAFPEIESEGSDHAAVLGLDRRGPARAQTQFQRHSLVGLPTRI